MVREKLSPLPLSNGRADEVIEEIAEQLESAYEDARSKGASEAAAMAKGLGQVDDWETLRRQLFRSFEGTPLPVWEQRGIFSPRRLPVWICLALTLALLATPSFRQALAILPVPFIQKYLTPWSPRVFSDQVLQGLEQSDDKPKYARTLAFVALHSPDDQQAMRAAQKAIALDPQFTWIAVRICQATNLKQRSDSHPWIERLKAWDLENGRPWLLEATTSFQSNWETRWARVSSLSPDFRTALAADATWRIPMEKAFAAPRLDFYRAQQFALDKQVLEEQGFDRPDMLAISSMSQPVPDFVEVSAYADFLLKNVGEAAEKAGRAEQALSAYQRVARFGENLRTVSEPLAEFYAEKFLRAAYQKMVPLLRSRGRSGEASLVEAQMGSLAPLDAPFWPFGSSTEVTAKRSAQVVSLAAPFVVLLSALTAVWLVSLFILKWNPRLSQELNRLVSLLNFAPPLLLLASFTMFIGYFPYARPIGTFTSKSELIQSNGLFFLNLSQIIAIDSVSEAWLDGMFWPCIWCAVVAIAGVIVLRWRAGHQGPDPTAAA
jgi:tetratricopeptide (TPR) repeat protein